MSTLETSPFVPGARVAIHDGWHNWREGFVEKAHKTGRFTLKGNSQQWRPEEPSRSEFGYKYWRAYKAGDQRWDRTTLRIWDDAADAEIKEHLAAQERRRRHIQLRGRFDRVCEGELTDTMLDQIEAALPALAEKKETMTAPNENRSTNPS